MESEDIAELRDGRVDIGFEGNTYECLYKHGDSEELYVFFSGARKLTAALPMFKRWSYYNYINGSMLSVGDPMFRDHDDLCLGWYYGNDKYCYCKGIAEMAQKLAELLGKKKLIFVGSSGGGYAALYCAACVPNSTAVAINPQIKLDRYYPGSASAFEKITGLNISIRDAFSRNHLPELIANAKDSHFLLIENIRSSMDMTQLDELCRELKTDYKYGLCSLSDNVTAWLYDADYGDPHNAQEFPSMFFAIDYLARNLDKREQLEELYLVFGELWYEHFEAIKKNENSGDSLLQKITLIGVVDDIAVSKDSVTLLEQSFSVPESDNIWNQKLVFDRLKPESTYVFSVTNPHFIVGNSAHYSFVIKNRKTGKVLLIKSLDADKSCQLIFRTSIDTSELEVKLYSGVAGEANNKALIIDKIVLKKI